MRPTFPSPSALWGRRRLTAAALALSALTTGAVLAEPAHAADWQGRLFTVAGKMKLRDVDDSKNCEAPFSNNIMLYDNTWGNEARSFTFKKTCGTIKAEVYVIGRLRDDNVIDASGWVRVSDGKTELAYRPWAAGFAPDFEQHVGPVTFGDYSRGLVTFEWVMNNDKVWE